MDASNCISSVVYFAGIDVALDAQVILGHVFCDITIL